MASEVTPASMDGRLLTVTGFAGEKKPKASAAMYVTRVSIGNHLQAICARSCLSVDCAVASIWRKLSVRITRNPAKRNRPMLATYTPQAAHIRRRLSWNRPDASSARTAPNTVVKTA